MGDEHSKDSGHKHLRPQWAGRDVLDKEHGSDLDREAALAEFDGKMPRHEAEDKAYSEYKRTQHAKAAAHHLRGIKLAEAAGDMREGRKHGLMYQLHCKQLGHEAIGPVPKEVQQHMDASGDDQSKVYSFKAHRGDIFVLPDELGKKEKAMATENQTPAAAVEQLDWQRHDDSSGGFYETLDKSERVLYRTWAVPQGAKPTKHVLVKHDGIKQTTLGYFETREKAMEQATGSVAMAKSERLGKEGPQLSLLGTSVPGAESLGSSYKKNDNSGLAAIRAAEEKGGKEASAGMGATSASVDKGSKPWEGSSSASGSSSSSSTMDKGSASPSEGGGENGGLNRIKAAMRRAEGQTSGEMPNFSMGEKCPKCGQADCKCGNMGKAELCKKCGKAANLCKCSGMSKAEAAEKLAADEKASHEAAYRLGKEVLAKVERTGSGDLVFSGTDKAGNPTGVSASNLGDRLHNLYVAAKFLVEKATK